MEDASYYDCPYCTDTCVCTVDEELKSDVTVGGADTVVGGADTVVGSADTVGPATTTTATATTATATTTTALEGVYSTPF